jgi:transposase
MCRRCCAATRCADICFASGAVAATCLKVIWHDGQGACLFTKRLERGRFLWPSPADGVVTISSAQLGYLLSGIDWRYPQETWRPTSVG